MNKKILLSFLIAALVIGGGGGVASAFYIPYGQDNEKGVFICGTHICSIEEYKTLQKNLNDAQLINSTGFNFTGVTHHIFKYSPSFNALKVNPDVNFKLDLHIPNHVDYYGIVLSFDDYVRLQNNVAVFAAVNIVQTTEKENVNYCDVANAIWVGQDDAFKAKYSKDLVVPSYCSTTPVPEFGSWSALVLVISIVSVIVFLNSRIGLRFRPDR